MNLFESINESLNKTVKNLSEEYLIEKKQKREISPEDEKDNEIIRKIISKLKKDKYYHLSDEEIDILSKHDIDKYDDTIYTELGSFDTEGNRIEHDRVIKGNGEGYYGRYPQSDPNKVDFVNMSRKQKERSKYYKDYFDTEGLRLNVPRVFRGVKKKSDPGGVFNTQSIERATENQKLKSVNNKYKSMKRDLSTLNKNAEYQYSKAENDREEILNEIKRLKGILNNLDIEAEERASDYLQRAKTVRDDIDAYMNDKRTKLQALKDEKRQKNESLLLEKRYIPTPEDKKDDELLRSLIKKIWMGESDDITDEERDAADRNGYSINNYYSRLEPKYGSVSAVEVTNPYHSVGNTGNRRVLDKYIRTNKLDSEGNRVKEKFPANVNLADLGRKRKEREGKLSFGEEGKPEHYRDERRLAHLPSYYENNKTIDNPDNFENVVRRNYNHSLKKDYDALERKVETKNSVLQEIPKVYDRGEEQRSNLIQRIKELKARLNNLDSQIEASVEDKRNYVKSHQKDINDILDNKRKEIQKKREERNNGNK